MADIAGLQADPRFQALPVDRQKMMLAHLSGGAPTGGLMAGTTPPPQAPKPESWVSKEYEDIAKPVTTGVAKGLYAGYEALKSPSELVHDPMKVAGQAEQALFTPKEKLPPLAQEVAEYVVPQTATGAGLMAASFALPEVGAARELGEAATLGERVLGTRLGRTAAETAIGAGMGALSGEGAGKGALQGAAQAIPAQTLGRIGQAVGSHLGEGSVIRETTQKFGKAISDRLPWIGKIEKGSDFADEFIHGKAVERAGNMLNRVKTGIAQDTRAHLFNVPDPATGQLQKMSFQEADKKISDLQQGLGFTMQGAERAGMTAREARAWARGIRDSLAKDLNSVKRGLGDQYLKFRRQFDAASTLSSIFDKNGLIGPNGLNQGMLIDRINEYSGDLERSLGKGSAKSLLDVLRRGFVGEGKDVAGKMGHGRWHFSMGVIPTYTRGSGQTFDPIGQVPAYIRPTGKPIEALIDTAISKMRKRPEESAIQSEGAKMKARNIAGPRGAVSPGRISAIEDTTKKINSRTQPDVQADLRNGRLSHGDVAKMLKPDKPGLAGTFEGLTPQQAVTAFAQADAAERERALPALAQHLHDSKLPPQQMQGILAQLKAVMAPQQQGEETA